MDGLSANLTPIEIKNKEFKRTFWGYSPREVVEFLDHTAIVWEQVQRHEKGLLGRIEELEKILEEWRGREEELRTIRNRAEDQATKAIEEANKEGNRYLSQIEKKAHEIRTETEGWLANVIDEIERTEARRQESVDALKLQIEEHYKMIEEGNSKPLGNELSELLQKIKGREAGE